MNGAILNLLEGYDKDVQILFAEIRSLILECVPFEIEEKLWAKIPSFYVGEKFVRLIPFKDHINLEASKITAHRAQLEQYKITPKGMLQIFRNQEIPYEVLKKIFTETLSR